MWHFRFHVFRVARLQFFRAVFFLCLLGSSAQVHAFVLSSIVSFLKTSISELSAWAVSTKQTALSAQQISDYHKAQNSYLATSIQTIAQNNRLLSVTKDYSAQFGIAPSMSCQQRAIYQAAWQQAHTQDEQTDVYANQRITQAINPMIKVEQTLANPGLQGVHSAQNMQNAFNQEPFDHHIWQACSKKSCWAETQKNAQYQAQANLAQYVLFKQAGIDE